MRFEWMIVLGLGVAASGGCGDDDGAPIDAGRDASLPVSDGGGVDGGPDAGPDAGPRDAGRPVDGGPEGFLADDACDPAAGRQVVAVASDGAAAVYLACPADGPAQVRALSLADRGAEAVLLADAAEADWSLELSPDDAHVLYGRAGTRWIRRVDATTEPVALSDGTTLAWRFVPSAAGLRLLVLEVDAASVRRIHLRTAADGFATATPLLDDLAAGANLELVSATGGTLIAIADDEGTRSYVRVPLQGSGTAAPLGFGPDDKGMVPVGLRDTGALLLTGGRLERVTWSAGEEFVDLAASGVLSDPSQLWLAERGPGNHHVHFIVGGNPARRDLTAVTAAAILATPASPAAHQLLSPDERTLVFHAGTALFGVPANGSAEPVEIARVGTPSTLTAIFKPDSSKIAAVSAGGGLLVAPVATAGMSLTLEAARVVPSSVTWGGDGTALWFIVADASGRTLHATGEAEAVRTVGRTVDAFWPVPGTNTSVVLRDGMLQVLGPR